MESQEVKFRQSVLFNHRRKGGKYAHGDTLKEAKEDLIYKLDGRNKSDFAGLNVGLRAFF